MPERPNRYDRHMNKKALEKKARAKDRHVRHQEDAEATEAAWTEFEAQEMEGTRMGIISSVRGKALTVMDNHQTWEASLSKKIPADLGARLVVGDKVLFRESTDETSGKIEGRQPRTSTLARFRGDRQRISAASQEQQVIAANVDTAVIVAAKDHPEFHPRFVDRYLVICQDGGIEPVVCINKSDLPGEMHPSIEWYKSVGIPVVETSTTEARGIDELKERIRGKLAVLVGNSGVGKSSLINAILGTDLETKTVSGKTGKGRHTTTASSLYNWTKDSYLIDTPGIRSLGVFHIEKADLQFGFPEFADFTEGCQYGDCSHSHEPVCGVKKAVEEGLVNKHRYESYLRMLEE